MKTIREAVSALREEDHRRALYGALIFIMLLILFFLLVGFEQPDPPIHEKKVEMVIEDLEFDLGSQPEGGSSSNDMNPDPVPVPENVVDPSVEHTTQDQSDVSVTNSNGTNNNTDNTNAALNGYGNHSDCGRQVCVSLDTGSSWLMVS